MCRMWPDALARRLPQANYPQLKRLLIAAACGVPCGIWLLTEINSEWLTIGVCLIVSRSRYSDCNRPPFPGTPPDGPVDAPYWCAAPLAPTLERAHKHDVYRPTHRAVITSSTPNPQYCWPMHWLYRNSHLAPQLGRQLALLLTTSGAPAPSALEDIA